MTMIKHCFISLSIGILVAALSQAETLQHIRGRTAAGRRYLSQETVVIYSDSFEHGSFGNWTPDGSNNAQLRENYSTEGTWAAFLRSIGFMTTSFDTSTYSGYRVTFDMYVRGIQHENIDGDPKGLILEHSSSGVEGSWETAEEWREGKELNGTGYYYNNVFQLDNFGSLPFDVTNGNLFLRFRMHGDEKDDHVFLDEVAVIGLIGTAAPTSSPTQTPTSGPTSSPTNNPSEFPTRFPTHSPSEFPSSSPTVSPTLSPTPRPSRLPTTAPTVSPSSRPTNAPTAPTPRPSPRPTPAPFPRGPRCNGGYCPSGYRCCGSCGCWISCPFLPC